MVTLLAFPLRKGQSAKVTETFSENLTKTDISALKLMAKPGGRIQCGAIA